LYNGNNGRFLNIKGSFFDNCIYRKTKFPFGHEIGHAKGEETVMRTFLIAVVVIGMSVTDAHAQGMTLSAKWA